MVYSGRNVVRPQPRRLTAAVPACGDDDADTGSDTTVATEIGDAASVEGPLRRVVDVVRE